MKSVVEGITGKVEEAGVKTYWMAELGTRNYIWRSFGATAEAAVAALKDAWDSEYETYRTSAGPGDSGMEPWDKYMEGDEPNLLEFTLGAAFRDYQQVTPTPSERLTHFEES